MCVRSFGCRIFGPVVYSIQHRILEFSARQGRKIEKERVGSNEFLARQCGNKEKDSFLAMYSSFSTYSESHTKSYTKNV